MTEPGRALLVRSAVLAVGLQWSMRLIGLVSVFILARMLSPADFGLVGLAMATVALVEIFSVVGLRQALLRIAEPDRSHMDTAWTLQLLIFFLVGLAVLAAAPVTADFYEQPELLPVMSALSLRFLFLGLINVGIVDFDRHFQFGRDLRMRVSCRLLSLAGTIAAALILQSYWALVIGLLLQSVLLAAASYLAHPYRPRFSLARRRELLNMSFWMFLNSSAQVLHHEVERLVVARFAPIHMTGLYSVSMDLGSIFTHEIATALNRVTFVTTARAGRTLSEAPERIGGLLGTYALIAAPLGLGLAATAEDTIGVLLGDQWRDAAPLLQIIAPASALYAVYKIIASSLQASGHERTAALLSMGGMGLLTIVAIAGGLMGVGVLGIAWLGAGVTLALLVAATVTVSALARVAPTAFIGDVVRPFAAAAIMLLAVRWCALSSGFDLVDLAVEVGIGALVYAGAVIALWWLSGRPRGAEAEALDLLSRIRRPARLSAGA